MPLQTRKTIVARDADSSEALDHMPVTRQHYMEEIAVRQKIEAELEEKNRILADYDTKLKDAEAALATVRKKWKQAATDLDKMKSSQQRGYHMTDSELKDTVSRLRYNISRFAIQYFGGRLPKDANIDKIVRALNGWRQLSKFLGNRDITISYIGSDRRRPYIVQALIWDTVYWAVFGEALWAGEKKMSVAFKDLSEQLQQSEKTQGSDSDIEICRRFCVWRAETAAMVIETINSSRTNQEKSKEFFLDGIESVCKHICKHLEPLTKATKGLREEVFDILQEAAKLDEAMKRQAVRLEWIIPEPQGPFDSDTMTLASGETWDADMDGVCLTTSPGLVRQGKSTGDDFGTETRLLSTEVSWYPSPVKVRRNRTV
ncbi:hypothetical protein CKAH01_06336 [Colletotrichum kahawae]|uniref:Uncharacterized protein n=1 Tax=Colletotrichum kahawae TaxID=34407 RepID=A0AAD9YBE5_COLKA|nr:hypothetical protein CKAH01_06336 [Colletotrichum kahawae]